MTLALPY